MSHASSNDSPWTTNGSVWEAKFHRGPVFVCCTTIGRCAEIDDSDGYTETFTAEDEIEARKELSVRVQKYADELKTWAMALMPATPSTTHSN